MLGNLNRGNFVLGHGAETFISGRVYKAEKLATGIEKRHRIAAAARVVVTLESGRQDL